MNKRTKSMNGRPGASSSFAAGVLIGLSIVAPVFAADDTVTDNWSLLLLIGSVVLLLAGLALKAINVSRARKLPAGSVPDMRRDLLASAEVDHVLTMGAVPERRFH